MTTNPNVQPIYPVKPILWRARLTNQVVPNYLPSTVAPITPQPALLGTASESGALIIGVEVGSVIPQVNGSTAGDGVFGLRTAGDEQWLQFYYQQFGDTNIEFLSEFPLQPNARAQFYTWGFPLLPAGQTGLALPPKSSLYVGLRVPAPAPGINVFVNGGHYSIDGDSQFNF
jgi:hypothetical protein